MLKKIKHVVCLVLTLIMISLSGCTSNTRNMGNRKDGNKINVYTSFYMMYDLAKKVGGDKIDIHNLVPVGTEPHDWEPATKDVAGLEKADVFIYNGAGMEPWSENILGSIENKKLIAVEASKGIKLLNNNDKDENLKYDPHVWLNPMNAKKEMEQIKDAFSKADPSNKDYYEKNYSDYAKKFDELDAKYKNTVSKFTKKDIIVGHQAFGYLCDAYGLNQVAIEGLSADQEPSPGKMAEITKFAKEHEVKYIFFEELISSKVSETIAKEVGAKTEVLNPLEGLKDEDIASGKDYFSVMEDNLNKLKLALQE